LILQTSGYKSSQAEPDIGSGGAKIKKNFWDRAKFKKFLQYKHIFLIFFLNIYITNRDIFEKFSGKGGRRLPPT
jgi:hypothetical protein